MRVIRCIVIVTVTVSLDYTLRVLSSAHMANFSINLLIGGFFLDLIECVFCKIPIFAARARARTIWLGYGLYGSMVTLVS